MKLRFSHTSTLSRILLVVFVVTLLIIGACLVYLKTTAHQDLLSAATTSPESNLESTNGATNILFLGFGGEGHEAPDLTDSIIFISLRHSDHSIRLISIPRDVWSETLHAKLNSSYHYGNSLGAGQGLEFSKTMISKLLGQPIHYALALDFSSFIRLIDAVGGIDVDIPRTFDDYKYPIPGQETAEPESARYEHLHFEKGKIHMDGQAALKYSRSRHAVGEAGTDFDRSMRQQLILSALQAKLVSSQTLLSPTTIREILSNIKTGLVTDIGETQFTAFLKYFLSFSRANQSPRSIELSTHFVSPKDTRPYAGQWVLIPSVSQAEIHEYVAKSLAE